MSNYEAELAAERAYVAMLYERFDELRSAAGAESARLRAAEVPGTEDGLFQRDALFTAAENRRAALDVADDGLCFGRVRTGTPAPSTSDGSRCPTRPTSRC